MQTELPAQPATAAGLLLNQLPRRARAVIEHLHMPADVADRSLLLRLIELGFLPGETVRIVARAGLGGEPIAVRLGGQSTFALRAREAALIGVRPLSGAETA